MSQSDPEPEGALDIEQLLDLIEDLNDEEIAELIQGLPENTIEALLSGTKLGLSIPDDPAEQARQIDSTYVIREHLQYLATVLANAVADVEAGHDRKIIVTMPPRAGKSTILSLYLIVWLLRKHPDWPFVLTSHEGGLATNWGRSIQQTAIDNPALGIRLARTPQAASEWATVEKGVVLSRGVRGSLTGRGAKVLVIDDPVKDFVEAHSETVRESTWNWWLTVAQTRLEPPSLVLVVMTRWHEDDFVGRLLSTEHEGDPSEWVVIKLAAIAEDHDDVLGREIGEPLLSPLLPNEQPAEATERWRQVERNVGPYAFASMYQQTPAPAKGAIFDTSWWRFWTDNPEHLSELEPERIILIDPRSFIGNPLARLLESWDMAFKGNATSDFVVGQRWCQIGERRLLLDQQRDRMSFTESLSAIKTWIDPLLNPYAPHTYERLVEDKANGSAIIDVLKDTVAHIVPTNPTDSKEARARAVTPECARGDVYLPHPEMPGFAWVRDLIEEARNFPHGANDDQVDGLSQALMKMRNPRSASIVVPGRHGAPQAGRTPVTSGRVPNRLGAAGSVRTIPNRGVRR